ncbi:LysE family translocator [Dyella subtropica]|uniref:LysE family translocator n=1 Tax=Dyella subtropica TaxID=2992127 RepID=UPI00225BE8BE|nr:LysE family translocator [Dyella subtropica]
MQALPAVAMLIFVSAITPGPNNLVVLRAALGGGLRAAWPAMVGILLGGVAMIALAQWGLASLLEGRPYLRTAVVMGGSGYLAWLGLALVWRRGGADREVDANQPNGAAGVFVFQFANPKSWTLVLTAVSALHGDTYGIPATILLMPIFVLISAACLAAWAALGRVAKRWLSDAVARLRFDRAMGALLLVSSAALLASH